jgi:uncharacterized membrane protein YkgB
MQNGDLTSVGRVFIGSSITLAGTIIGILLPGVRIARIPFLLLTPAVLVVASTVRIVFSMPGSRLPL